MKLKLSCFLSALALLCFCVPGVKAQSTSTQYFLPEPFPRSPTATAFEKYGTYKVNEFTGVPDISIPLYTIEAGSFKIPIILSYHASGNKVTDVASWVGLGWSLSAGGQISRRVMGTPDDDWAGYLNGYMWPVSSLNSHTADGVQYLEYASNGTYDTKPDIYSYDFPGFGGKFFFDGSKGSNFTPRFLSYTPLKLTHNNPISFYGPGNGLMNFTITDEHGSLYNFGGTGGMETTTSGYGGVTGKTAVSTWKLSSMISQNRRDTVSFSYQADSVYYPSADAEIYTVIDQVAGIGGATPYGNASYLTPPSTPGMFSQTTEELNQQINFKNGKVVFEWASSKRTDIPGGHYLKDVQVWKYNYGTRQMELQKTIMFYTSYFVSGGSNRLRLDSIQIQDKAGSEMQHYRFGYNTSVALPAYSSKAQDMLGYYNGCDGKPGKPTNTMLTPTQTISYNYNGTVNNVSIGQANRLPDSVYMQAFMLDTIHYPTGGYTTFAYQTNHVVTSGVDALGEGLRIRAISSYDGVNPVPIVKTYVYNASRMNYFSPYSYFLATQNHRHYTPSNGTGGPVMDGTEQVRSYTSNPHCDLEPFDAAYVVYPSVTEYIGTPGNNIGRTDYLFSDHPDEVATASAEGTQIVLSYYFDRGHLVSRKDYLRKNDGTYQIVKADTNGYAAFPEHYYPAVGLAVSRTWYNDGTVGMPIPPGGANPDDGNAFGWATYDIFTQDSQLTGTISTVYDLNDPTKFTTSGTQYIYDDTTHMQVVRTIHTDSKGDTHVTANKYPYNYASGNAVIDSMVNRHMYGDVIEKFDTLKNATTGVNAVTSGQINKFKYGYIPFSIVPSTISTLSVGQPLTNFVPSAVSSGNLTSDSRYVQMISFDQYDTQNNPTQYTPRNANPTSIIWNYQYESPVAQIKNATLSQFAYTSFEGDNRGNWSYSGTPIFNNTAPSGSMVYPLSSGDVTLNFSFDNSKTYVLSYWSNNGPATIYAGGYLTSNPLTSTNGWTYYESTVSAGTSTIDISGSTTIDELRLYPVGAQMTTYAYDPSGVRTISDTKGQNNYFEYDFAQRLKNSKDYLGNIIANYSYHTYDQTVANQLQTATLTRNNCPANTAPTSLTYSVPANKYYSSTQASANAEALYDAQVNGQAKANTVCGCPQIMVNVTLSNTSGFTSYQVTFAGLPPYNMPASGTTVIQVPQGTYSTVSISASSQVHTFAIGAYSPITGHSASVGPVSVTSGQNLTISIY